MEGEMAKTLIEIVNKELGTSHSFLSPVAQKLTAFVQKEIAEHREAAADDARYNEQEQ